AKTRHLKVAHLGLASGTVTGQTKPTLIVEEGGHRYGESRTPETEHGLPRPPAHENEIREATEFLFRTGLVVFRELDREKLIQGVIEIVRKLTGAEFSAFVDEIGTVSLIQDASRPLRSADIGEDPRFTGTPFPLDESD